MTQIRPLERGDLEEVAELRKRVFARSRRPPAQVAPYLERLFFDGPWRAEDLPSLVATGPDGRILGFAGRLVRPFAWNGGAVRVVVPTQLMVDSKGLGFLALELLKEVRDGAQDMIYADAANEPARKLWQLLGGETPALLSQRWRVELRPARAGLRALGPSPAARAVRLALRAGVWPIDRLTARVRREALGEIGSSATRTELTADRFAERALTRRGRDRLLPAYSPAAATWMFEELRERSRGGTLLGSVLVRGADVVGEYLVLVTGGGSAHAVHFWSPDGEEESTMAHLLMHAEDEGASSVEGRLTRGASAGLRGIETFVDGPPPWTFLRGRDPELVAAVHRGRALLDRMEGEWWLNL